MGSSVRFLARCHLICYKLILIVLSMSLILLSVRDSLVTFTWLLMLLSGVRKRVCLLVQVVVQLVDLCLLIAWILLRSILSLLVFYLSVSLTLAVIQCQILILTSLRLNDRLFVITLKRSMAN